MPLQPHAGVDRSDRDGRGEAGEPWKELAPTDPAGVRAIGPVHLTPDGKSYVYSFGSTLGDLYLAEGLK